MNNQSVEFEATVSATIEGLAYRDDYGVPNSPVWTEYEAKDWASYTIDIAGVTVKLTELPEVLRNALWEMACDQLEYAKWETVE